MIGLTRRRLAALVVSRGRCLASKVASEGEGEAALSLGGAAQTLRRARQDGQPGQRHRQHGQHGQKRRDTQPARGKRGPTTQPAHGASSKTHGLQELLSDISDSRHRSTGTQDRHSHATSAVRPLARDLRRLHPRDSDALAQTVDKARMSWTSQRAGALLSLVGPSRAAALLSSAALPLSFVHATHGGHVCDVACGLLQEAAAELGAKDSHKKKNPEPQTPECLAQASLGPSGVGEAVLSLLSTMRQSHVRLDIFTYNKLVGAACSLGDMPLALELRHQCMPLDSIDSDAITTDALLRGHVDARQIDAAKRLFEEQREGALADERSCNVMMRGLCSLPPPAGEADALALFSAMRDSSDLPSPTAHTYTHAMKGLADAGDLDAARRLLESASCVDGIAPTAGMYSLLIKRYWRVDTVKGRGDFGAMRELMRDMRAAGLSLDDATYASLFRDRIERRRELEMATAAVYAETKSSSSSLTLQALSAMLAGPAIASTEASATVETAAAAPQSDPFASVDTSVLPTTAEFIASGITSIDSEEAAVLDAMLSDSDNSSTTHNALVTALAHRGLTESASRVLESMPGLGVDADARSYAALVGALVDKGDVDAAVQIVYEMRASGVDTSVYIFNLLIKGRCQAGDVAGATRLVREMRADGVTPDRFTYGTLLQGHADNALQREKEGSDEQAEGVATGVGAITDILGDMRRDRVDADLVTYRILLKCFAVLGEMSHLWVVLEHMQMAGPAPDAKTYEQLQTLCEARGDIPSSRRLAQKRQQLNRQKEGRGRREREGQLR